MAKTPRGIVLLMNLIILGIVSYFIQGLSASPFSLALLEVLLSWYKTETVEIYFSWLFIGIFTGILIETTNDAINTIIWDLVILWFVSILLQIILTYP